MHADPPQSLPAIVCSRRESICTCGHCSGISITHSARWHARSPKTPTPHGLTASPTSKKLLSAAREVPGVTATAISTNATPPESGFRASFEVLGKPASSEQIRVELVSPEYFSTLEIPLTQGRICTDTENRTGAHFVVINQALARVYFPNGDAIGHSIKFPQNPNAS